VPVAFVAQEMQPPLFLPIHVHTYVKSKEQLQGTNSCLQCETIIILTKVPKQLVYCFFTFHKDIRDLAGTQTPTT
jgi:hypothetical protein